MKTCSWWSIMIHFIVDVILNQNKQRKKYDELTRTSEMEWIKILTFSISSMTSSMVIIPTTSSSLGSFNSGLSPLKFKISGWDSPDHLLLLKTFSFPGKTLADNNDDDAVLIIDCLKLLLCTKLLSPSISNLTSSPKYHICSFNISTTEKDSLKIYRFLCGNSAHC